MSEADKQSLSELLNALQANLIDVLLLKLKEAKEGGDVQSSVYECVRKLLADNNIQVTPEANPNVLKLAGELPQFPDEQSA